MSKTTKRIMKKVRWRLTRLIGMEVSACGYQENIERAVDFRLDLEYYLEDEIERLARKAGEE